MDLTGQLVRLRGLRVDDAPRMAELLADPRVVANLDHWAQLPHTVDALQRWITTDSQAAVRWAVETADDGSYIGNTGLESIDHHNRHCSWGIWLAPPDRWGRGYGTEACMLCVDYAFRHLAMEKVCLYVYAGNDAARRVYEKAGFAGEGIFHRHFWRSGELVDVETMAVFRDHPLYRERIPTRG